MSKDRKIGLYRPAIELDISSTEETIKEWESAQTQMLEYVSKQIQNLEQNQPPFYKFLIVKSLSFSTGEETGLQMAGAYALSAIFTYNQFNKVLKSSGGMKIQEEDIEWLESWIQSPKNLAENFGLESTGSGFYDIILPIMITLSPKFHEVTKEILKTHKSDPNLPALMVGITDMWALAFNSCPKILKKL